MFSFLDYVFEIWTVGKVNGVDTGVALSMFLADVRAGVALPYNTGKVLADFDFASARGAWVMLTEDEQTAALEEWHAFIADCYADDYTSIGAAVADGKDAVAALVSEWRERGETETETEAPDECD